MTADIAGDGVRGPLTALQCLAAIARHHGLELDPDRLAHDAGLTGEPTPDRLHRLAVDNGLTARLVDLDWAKLVELGPILPAIAFLANGNSVIVSSAAMQSDGQLRLQVVDPLAPQAGIFNLDQAQFEAAASGRYLLLKRTYGLSDPEQPFSLRWFVPEVLRQRSFFTDIGLISLALNGLALAVPIFFQIVIDKVLVHHSLSTLAVLGSGVVLALLFDALLGYLRGYLLLHATTKIDIRLATRTFDRLLSLPNAFFERNTAGVLTKHMQQASSVREFLTGRLFMTLLDASVLIVFLPILAFYSLWLTLVVLGFSASICLIIAVLMGPYRTRLEKLYRAEGSRQTMLVETIHGMQTVKTLGLEARQKGIWDSEAAQAIDRRFEVGKISIVARQISGLLDRLTGVAIVWIGALLVFGGRLTVGELVAFQMLAGRVSGPLVALVSLIHEYQEAALSVRMLGEVMNRQPERNLGRGLRTVLQGRISISDVRFSYPGMEEPALAGVSVEIPPKTLVAIVGPSGSGKSTLTRLIQTLHPMQNGVLRFDGMDSREMDIAEIRRQIGVVLQDAFLFRGTIRENIAVGYPGATLAEIMAAAQEAGATEFIELLPQGLETMIEEGGTNLSGGQKQRLSIARALLRRPPILILDEATSALDPDTEATVVANLERYAKNCTTIVISHRLTTIRDADMILVLDRGRLIANGRHHDLLASCPIYAHLWHQQTKRAA